MPTSEYSRRARHAVVFARVLQWRHSLFWSIVPAMFVTSCVCAAVLITGATMLEDRRLRAALAPDRLRTALAEAVRASTPLVTQDGKPTPWCTDTLKVLAERALTHAIRDRTGDSNANGFYQASGFGRLAVELHGTGGSRCRFGADDASLSVALRQQFDRVRTRGGAAMVAEHADGWTSVAALAVAGRADAATVPVPVLVPVLVAGVHILSPWVKLMQPRSVFKPLAVFVLSINAVSALLLVFLLIRRIRRADAAATAWTSGDLATRINDTGRDELSRLVQKFDVMADAMSGVIAVKQALAAAEERNRLARDLHDSAKQRAFALNLQLSAAREMLASNSDSAPLLDAALSLTSHLQQDLTSVIGRLAGATIAEAGLRHALAQGVDSMLKGSRIDWSLTIAAGLESELDAAPDVARQLFLITLEAVANSLRHANCTRCAISGTADGALLTWRIADNGAGMAAVDTGADGMGLANMKLRATSLKDGTFAIVDSDDGGVAVVVTFRATGTGR